MISNGSTLALRNLLNYQKTGLNGHHMDSVSRSLDLKELPTLSARKQKALEQELDQNLANSCSSDEVTTPPKDFNTVRNLVTQCFKAPPEKSFDSEADERPIDYSKKYGDATAQPPQLPGPSSNPDEEEAEPSGFQETDLDQPTDYSKVYAENDVSDLEDEKSSSFEQQPPVAPPAEEDQVKCFFTEGTPQAISNAPSITDLRKATMVLPAVKATKTATFHSGTHSPERPVNYCVEGTPGGLSRCDSLSDLETEGAARSKPMTRNSTPPKAKDVKAKDVNFVDETPLMFSRQSSLGSLSEEECNADDKSSVVSEFR